MPNYEKEYQEKLQSIENVAKLVRSHDHVYTLHSMQISVPIMDAIYDRKEELEDVTVMTSTLMDDLKMLRLDAEKTFRMWNQTNQ